MTDKNKINVVIDGRNFTVVGTEDESYVRNLAAYVDRKIKNVSSKNDRLSPTMAATLVALNIADELHKTMQQLKDLEIKAKEPLEKFSGVKKELEEAREKIRELEEICLEYKDEAIQTKLSKEDVFKEINRLEDELDFKELEADELHKLNKSLQDKIFENQLELVEVKKQLSEALKLLSKEK